MDRQKQMERDANRLTRQKQMAGLNWWRPKVGKNLVRILPHWSGDLGKVFYKSMLRHFGVGPEKNNIICRKMSGKDEECPVCDYVADLRKSGSKEDIFAARDLQSKERFMVNMIDVKNPADGVQIWEMGVMLFNDILLMFLDPDYGDLDSLEEGRHLKINRVGEGKFDTRYKPLPAVNITKIDARVMEKAKDLDELFPVPTVGECVAMLEGEEVADEAEDVSAFLETKEEEEEETVDVEVKDEKEPADVEIEEGEEGKDEVEEEVLTIPMEDEEEEKPKAKEKLEEKEKSKEKEKEKPPSNRKEQIAKMRDKLDKKK